jgi:cyclic pyranopterin phosphate synthase
MNVVKPSHIGADGTLHMVDVSAKPATARSARAEALVRLGAAAAEALRSATLAKGDALVAAQLAGIMAAKRTGELIPLAHALSVSSVEVAFAWEDDLTLRITTAANTVGPTGVEMEALVAAAAAALTIYDMCKAVDKGIAVDGLRLISKSGGKSGSWEAT